jgi:hypothetical protein
MIHPFPSNLQEHPAKEALLLLAHGSSAIRTDYKAGCAFCAEVTSAPFAAGASAKIEPILRKQVLPPTDGVQLAGRDDACALLIDASINGVTSSCAPRDFPWRRQTDLATEDGEARIVPEAQDKGVNEEVADSCISVAPGPVEPRKGLL